MIDLGYSSLAELDDLPNRLAAVQWEAADGIERGMIRLGAFGVGLARTPEHGVYVPYGSWYSAMVQGHQPLLNLVEALRRTDLNRFADAKGNRMAVCSP